MRIAVTVLACLVLSACGPREPPPEPEDTVFGDQIKTLDKARGVQDDFDQRKRDLDERMKQAEDGG